MRTKEILSSLAFLLVVTPLAYTQRTNDDLVVLYDFTEGEGNIVRDRGPSLGAPGDPIDLLFDPNELSSNSIAGQFGDRPGLISWGDGWLNINKDHPVDDGIAHGTPDAAVVWDGGPGESEKIVNAIVESGEFTIEAWVRPESLDNRSNPGRIIWMTVEGTNDAANFVLGQQSCCDGSPAPGGIQIRLRTDFEGQTLVNSDADLFEEGELIHVVHTHDSSSEESKVYLNREGEAFDDAPIIDEFIAGAFDAWDPDYVLAVGNDPYRFSRWFGGELHLIAIYGRAFTVSNIQQHFEAGPATGTVLPGDFDGDGELTVLDVNMLGWEIGNQANDSSFDLNADTLVNEEDLNIWVKDVRKTWFGDANVDGEFNSSDLVTVFQEGKFEREVDAFWSEGDWTGDHRFDSTDFVKAFQDGGFEQGPLQPANVPEPSPFLLLPLSLLTIGARHRRQRTRGVRE